MWLDPDELILCARACTQTECIAAVEMRSYTRGLSINSASVDLLYAPKPFLAGYRNVSQTIAEIAEAYAHMRLLDDMKCFCLHASDEANRAAQSVLGQISELLPCARQCCIRFKDYELGDLSTAIDGEARGISA